MPKTIEELEKTIEEETQRESKLAHDLDSIAGVMEGYARGSRERKSLGNEYSLTASGVFSAQVAIIKAKIEVATLKGESTDALMSELATAQAFLNRNDDKIVRKSLGSPKKMGGRLVKDPEKGHLVYDKRGNLLGVAGEPVEFGDLLHFGPDGKLYKVKESDKK